MNTYTTGRDAIEQAIIPAIESSGVDSVLDYDLHAIFQLAFDWNEARTGFVQTVTDDEFWQIVADNTIRRTFTATVEITCATREQAQQVLNERLQYDEDYGFSYTITGDLDEVPE